jgi:hypothetical protein
MVKMTAALQPLPQDQSTSQPQPDSHDMPTDSNIPFSAGVICCYSLKNIAHPEYLFVTESGVMCLDFHPQVQYPILRGTLLTQFSTLHLWLWDSMMGECVCTPLLNLLAKIHCLFHLFDKRNIQNQCGRFLILNSL